MDSGAVVKASRYSGVHNFAESAPDRPTIGDQCGADLALTNVLPHPAQ